MDEEIPVFCRDCGEYIDQHSECGCDSTDPGVTDLHWSNRRVIPGIGR